MNHAPAILATLTLYCIHRHIIHQARGRQTVENVNAKHAVPIGCHSKHPSAVELLKLLIQYNETAFAVDYKGENGQQQSIQLTLGVCCILRLDWLVRPVWPVHGSYTGQCVVYTDRAVTACLHHRMVWLHTHNLAYHIFTWVVFCYLPCSFRLPEHPPMVGLSEMEHFSLQLLSLFCC